METNSKPTHQVIDDESEAIVMQGASRNQLAMIFSIDTRDMMKKLNGNVQPCGVRKGHSIYAIKDCAPYLVKPPYDMDEFIRKMTSLADLPMFIRKEYWAGMRSRQLFEKEAAELWPTTKVIETISALLKTLRLSLLQSREAVERETELTDRQRAIITRIIDNALENAHATTTREFEAFRAASHTADVRPERTAGPEEL